MLNSVFPERPLEHQPFLQYCCVLKTLTSRVQTNEIYKMATATKIDGQSSQHRVLGVPCQSQNSVCASTWITPKIPPKKQNQKTNEENNQCHPELSWHLESYGKENK